MKTLLSSSTTHTQRAPPPSLFLGPPSRNTSNISLPSLPPAPPPIPSNAPPHPPLLSSRSARGGDPSSSTNQRVRYQPSATQTENDRADALWAEMQATLADVEMDAFSSTHVFGPAHAAALEELRAAQVDLAKTWAKDARESVQEKEIGKEEGGKQDEMLDEESDEEEINAVRRRREANQRFFGRISDGMEDVVGKLEGVAKAMAIAEKESRNIWGGAEAMAPESSNVKA